MAAGNSYRFTMQGNVDGITPPLASPSLTSVAFEADELPPTPPSRRRRRTLPGFLGENAISLDSSITYTAEQSGTLYLQAASVANRWQGVTASKLSTSAISTATITPTPLRAQPRA